jgi:hypothetical protein
VKSEEEEEEEEEEVKPAAKGNKRKSAASAASKVRGRRRLSRVAPVATIDLHAPRRMRSDAKLLRIGVFGWEIAHGPVTRRPPISLNTMIPGATRTTLGFGLCPSFKRTIFCAPVLLDSHFFRRLRLDADHPSTRAIGH